MITLTKTTSLYLSILHAVYLTCRYVASNFGFVLEDDITSLPTQITEQDGITKITFLVPVAADFICQYPAEKYKDTFQEIIDMVQDTEVPFEHYKLGNTSMGLIPPLYLDSIVYEKDHAEINIIYVNNTASYLYVKPRRPNPLI